LFLGSQIAVVLSASRSCRRPLSPRKILVLISAEAVNTTVKTRLEILGKLKRKSNYIVTYQGGLRELKDVDSDWYWIYWLKIATTTDDNHWEKLSTGSFLNPLVNSFFVLCLLTNSLRELTGIDWN
jgi:hypothetical protein